MSRPEAIGVVVGVVVFVINLQMQISEMHSKLDSVLAIIGAK